MIRIKKTLVGVSPLIVHNGQLADPTNKFTRELKIVSKKRQQTDDDLEQMRQIEWRAGLYTDATGSFPVVPSDNVLALVIAGARKSKLGKDAQAGVIAPKTEFVLKHEGPADLLEMYNSGKFTDYRAVKVQTSRVMRTRPRFDVWTLPIELDVIEDVIDAASVEHALTVAGQVIGLGDFRPRYGRFEVK